MNYIGSKFSLLTEIERVLDAGGVPASGIALDLFAGTGVVAQLLKKRGHIAYANDWQHYSYLTCVAHIEHNDLPLFDTLLANDRWGAEISSCTPIADLPVSCRDSIVPPISDSPAVRVLSYLSRLPGESGPFYHTYCEGGELGRLYFSRDNGLRIQAIRDMVEVWSREALVTPQEKAWLVASLLEGADRVANTASVYGAYLKRIKKSAEKPLKLCLPMPVASACGEQSHRAFCEDSEQLLSRLSDTRLRLVYIDPPYNQRQYNSNYHILETMAKWDLDSFVPKGITGLRSSRERRSEYCSKTKVLSAFRRLLGLVNADYALFSYSSEGLVPKQDLEEMFGEICSEVHFEEIPYRRFRADNDGENRVYKGDLTMEYLILGKVKERDSEIENPESGVVGGIVISRP